MSTTFVLPRRTRRHRISSHDASKTRCGLPIVQLSLVSDDRDVDCLNCLGADTRRFPKKTATLELDPRVAQAGWYLDAYRAHGRAGAKYERLEVAAKLCSYMDSENVHPLGLGPGEERALRADAARFDSLEEFDND